MNADAIKDLRHIIESSIINEPRSLQTWAGPSELAISCDRCLVHKLAGTPATRPPHAPWMPFVGTAVHAELACIVARHETTRADYGMPPRYLIEHRVNVGTVGGVERTGSVDLHDMETGTVIDYKCVGATTMTKARKGDISKAYQGQVQLYGKGMQDAGHDVRACTIWFLPRNGFHLGEGLAVEVPYSRAHAQAVLDRANQIAVDIDTHGVDAVLAGCAPHTGEEFSCRTFPDGQPVATDSDRASAAAGQLAGLLA